MPMVRVQIDEKGEMTMEGVGFEGTACDEGMKAYEEMSEVVETTKKPEYSQVSKQRVQEKQ